MRFLDVGWLGAPGVILEGVVTRCCFHTRCHPTICEFCEQLRSLSLGSRTNKMAAFLWASPPLAEESFYSLSYSFLRFEETY